jgi:ABC-type nitrate/sulfonate/bicarbonate transport system substrate-binding protein
VAHSRINVVYGHLEGTGTKFARDPSGYLSIEKGIFARHGLEVHWEHVQGTEERYRRLEENSAQVSLVVGRASLQHFLNFRRTRILGCAMNSCPYLLISDAAIREIRALKHRTVACREGPARGTPLARAFQDGGGLKLGEELAMRFVASDQDAFIELTSGKVEAALLPRPYGFIAEERDFNRLSDWPDVLDDPLPITIEVMERFVTDRPADCEAFLTAHRDGIRYLKDHRAEAMRMLQDRFAHSELLAAKTCDDYFVYMDERLKIDFAKFQQLLAQFAPLATAEARQIVADWIRPGGLRD